MRLIRQFVATVLMAGLVLALTPIAPAAAEPDAPRPPANSATCAGIRGNGQNLFAHYGALARLVEEYGPVTCVAGGSSGSITAFLIESMWANPVLHQCGDERCDDEQLRARYALMIKSVIGVVDAGVFADVATVAALVGRVEAEGIVELLNDPDQAEAGVAALVRILRDLGPLINIELIELLTTGPDPVFHALDIIDGLEKGLQFIVDDPAVFLRTSVIDFDAFASLVGLYGSFYAGYGPTDADGVAAWLEDCASASVGLTWQETAAVPGSASSCGQTYTDLFNAYREAFAFSGAPNRADDPVGLYLPSFGVTGVLTGAAIGEWQAAREAWLAAEPIPFEPDFTDVGTGWWGQDRELARMDRTLDRQFSDLGSNQFVPLGAATWREVLKSSPAEPGFSPAVPLSSGFLSVGGWADPLRVTPLEALGAKRTVTINRVDGVGGFTASVTELLNASPAELEALYSTVEPSSTFYVSLAEATGVWCTNWDGQGGDPNLLFNDAYNSPFITSDAFFLEPDLGYPNVGSFSLGGCTPGVPV